ncbi:hypothetical protein [Lentibacter algarum]|jgi:hypothetical protein|uniref:hypothetical protein n=1 Tax=Lentibacter algarum TaxID=576131 RepID=UPI002302389B|nr:hypothetical protein [Lentibacter algarum]WIF32519.1 hypothetical protein LentiSH36_02065 [Lentibacter algarum]
MKPADLEIVYEDLATTLDATKAEKRELLLAKLALLLVHDLGDAARAREHIAAASANLDA